MSRSYKKNAVFTCTGSWGKYHKKLCHRINRMLARSLVYLPRNMYKLRVNPYDICDYRFREVKGSEWYDKARRK